MTGHLIFASIFGLLLAAQSGNCLPYSKALPGRPSVTVNEGVINGMYETQNGVDMSTYKGIPFALPPVDLLRFMPPVAVGPWSTELDASKLPHKCPQIVSGREDCLYLNVYTPANATETLAVMVWIHGGAYVVGSSKIFDLCYPLVRNNVIFVSIQYRLGLLGFLSTGDDVVPGNMGLQDQTLALKWIKDNIAAFGGDSDRITIFGESAGASSTHLQTLTSYADGLFNQYILMSGNGLTPWATARDYYEVSRDVALRNDCPQEPSEALIACLQNVSNYIVLSAMIRFYADWNLQPFRFGPRVDGDYLEADPAQLMKDGRYSQVPSLMGVCQDEMALETGEMYLRQPVIDDLIENFTVNGQPSLMLFDDEDPLNTATTVYNYFCGGYDIDDADADNLTAQYTQRCFHIPHDWVIELQADDVPTYAFEFDYRGTTGLTDAYISRGLNISTAAEWIAHGDDMQYIFQLGAEPLSDPNDVIVGCLYSTYFTNFAKFGDPTPGTGTFCVDSSTFVKWDAADSTNMMHMSIYPTPAMVSDLRVVDRTFWESLPLRINAILQS